MTDQPCTVCGREGSFAIRRKKGTEDRDWYCRHHLPAEFGLPRSLVSHLEEELIGRLAAKTPALLAQQPGDERPFG